LSTEITDDTMRQMLTTTKPYTIVILHSTPQRNRSEDRPIVWEHARRNFALRADGKLVIVCPVSDGSDVSGLGIFNATVEETTAIMEGDPGVQAGLFTYEIHPTQSFPGDRLP
jgi:hypothetical protein